jgi:hypothetical protein
MAQSRLEYATNPRSDFATVDEEKRGQYVPGDHGVTGVNPLILQENPPQIDVQCRDNTSNAGYYGTEETIFRGDERVRFS